MFQPIPAQLYEDAVDEQTYNPPRLILIFSVDHKEQTIFYQDERGHFQFRHLQNVKVVSMVEIKRTGILRRPA